MASQEAGKRGRGRGYLLIFHAHLLALHWAIHEKSRDVAKFEVSELRRWLNRMQLDDCIGYDIFDLLSKVLDTIYDWVSREQWETADSALDSLVYQDYLEFLVDILK